MDRQKLGRIFSVGLALAGAGCSTEARKPDPGTKATPDETSTAAVSGSATNGAVGALAPSSSALAEGSAVPETSAVASAAAPPENDADAFVAGLKPIDMKYPVALGDDVELVGYVLRRDGQVVCDPAPCAKEWGALLPSVADHAIVKKAGKLVAASKATWVDVVGPIKTPAAAAARVRLERSLATCKRVGKDDVECAPSTTAAAFESEGPDGFVVATYSPNGTCPYGVRVPAGGPSDVGARFVLVASDGKIAASPNALAERLAAAQRTRNKPVCRYPVVRGRGYAGYRDRDEGRTLLEHFAHAARQEAAAVVAFDRLADELASFDAPQSLVARARRAADDERRHAAFFAHEARKVAAGIGATFEPAALEPCDVTPRSLEAFLVENAVEGCANETYAAVLATHQAAHAPTLRLRRALTALAADERDHAALAFDVHAWGCARLDARAADRVHAARASATMRLRTHPPATEAVAASLGEPDAAFASRAFGHVAEALQGLQRASSPTGA